MRRWASRLAFVAAEKESWWDPSGTQSVSRRCSRGFDSTCLDLSNYTVQVSHQGLARIVCGVVAEFLLGAQPSIAVTTGIPPHEIDWLIGVVSPRRSNDGPQRRRCNKTGGNESMPIRAAETSDPTNIRLELFRSIRGWKQERGNSMTVDTSLATEEHRACLLVDALIAQVPPLAVMRQQVEETLSRAEQCEAVARVLQAKVDGRRR